MMVLLPERREEQRQKQDHMWGIAGRICLCFIMMFPDTKILH